MTSVMDLVERYHRRHGAAAQVCVVRDGRVVLDRVVRCRPESLFLIYSASKPFMALLVHLLAERGRIGLDDPVASVWPRFARHGKETITVRQVLQHRAGVPVAGSLWRTVRDLADWEKSVRDAEEAKPRWAAGQVPAYHLVTYGFILGEIVRRVTGTPVREALSRDLLDPLGLRDTHLGLPDQALPRAVPVRATHPGEWINQRVFNRRRVRQAVIPAAGIFTTAVQLARFYTMLVRGGELDGVRVLKGFHLGGPGDDPRDMSRVMGSASSPETFGHGGNASCIAWADPTRNLVLAYLSNLQPGDDRGFAHLEQVSDAVLGAFG